MSPAAPPAADPAPAAAEKVVVQEANDAGGAANPGPVARITAVEIENLRGIRTGKLEGLAPLTVLTGPNGSGKSTVLDALDIGGSPNPAEAVRDAVERRESISGAARWLLWRGGRVDSNLICESPEGGRRTTTLTYKRQPDGTAHTIQAKVRTRGAKDGQPVGKVGVIFYNNGHSSVGSPGAPPMAEVSEVIVIEGKPRVSRRELHQLYSAAAERGRRVRINAIARDLVPSVDHLEILTEGDSPVVHLVWSDHSLPAAFSGDGVFAALRLSMEMDDVATGVALLEEPEAHLHPAAMVLVARAIVNAVRAGTQVVLTTHSIEFLDCLLDECEGDDGLLALFRVHLRDGELISSRHPGADVRFVRDEVAKDLR